MKKKILFLSPLPPPHYGSAMSSEMCLKILKESKDFEVRNIKLNYSRDMNDVGRINLDKIKGIFSVKKRIREEIKEFNPDIIYLVPATYSFGLLRDWFFVREIKKHWKGKILFHIRSRILDKIWNSFFGKKLLRGMYMGNKAIVLGKELINDLRGIIPKKDISILPNAIKSEVSENELKRIIQERKKNKQFNILFLSNMDKSKGWPKLLEACKILNEKEFNFKCDFVGAWQSEKDKRYFKEFTKKNKLEKKVFSHGRKTGKEKNKILEKSHILVFPTEYKLETFGRVILEAMMFSIPVIANSIATIPSTVQDGKTGFLLKKNTPEKIAEKIEKLIKNEKLREKMGRKGRKRFLEKYELKEYEKKFKGIFRDF
ncbi:MAG: glycosyltransferase family 4 protein [Candidatus Pacearchaeota archaeon]